MEITKIQYTTRNTVSGCHPVIDLEFRVYYELQASNEINLNIMMMMLFLKS